MKNIVKIVTLFLFTLALIGASSSAIAATRGCKNINQKLRTLGNNVLPPCTFTTSEGAVLNFHEDTENPGIETPDGAIWSMFQGTATNADGTYNEQNDIITDAEDMCAAISAELPTQQDYKNLMANFEMDNNNYSLTEKGKKQLYIVFPDMRTGFAITQPGVPTIPSRGTPGNAAAIKKVYRTFWTTTDLPSQFVFNLTAIFSSERGDPNIYELNTSKRSVRCIWR